MGVDRFQERLVPLEVIPKFQTLDPWTQNFSRDPLPLTRKTEPYPYPSALAGP